MRQALGLFLLLALLYLLTLGGHLYSPDEEILFRTTEALTTRGCLAIEPLAGFATRPPAVARGDGREFAQYGIGQPILAIPFYRLGVLIGHLAPDKTWLDLQERMFVYEPPLSAAGMTARMGLSFFNLLVTALSGVALFLLARRLCGAAKPAWIAALCWGAGSMAWPHARTFFTEPLAGLCLLVALHQMTRIFLSASQPAGQSKHIADCGLRIADYESGDHGYSVLSPQSSVPSSQHSAPSTPHSALRTRNYGAAFWAGVAAGYGCLVRIDSVVFLPGLTLLMALGDFEWIADCRLQIADCGLRPGDEGLRPGDEGLRKSAIRNPQSAIPRPAAASVLGAALRHCFRRHVLARLLFFALPVALAGSVILLLNYLHFGHPLATGYSDQPEGIQLSTPVLAGLYGFLMSVGKGMFFFSPVLILAFWGIRPMFKARPVFAASVWVVFLSFLLAMSTWRNWAGGWCWGPRHIMQVHALLALPIAFWIAERWTSARRVTLTTLMVAAAAVQIYGCSQNFITFYRLYYQDPRGPTARALYDPGSDSLLRQFAVFPRDPQTGLPRIPVDAATGKPVFEPDPRGGLLRGEVSPFQLPAPINDSIYIVQNSQWTRYAEMWRMGMHDFFWLRVAGR
jgi:hypothetical protein